MERIISLSANTAAKPVIVQQNDLGSRTLRFFVLDEGGQPYSMAGLSANVYFRKNGATSKGYPAAIGADGWVSLTVPEAVTKNAGLGQVQVVFTKAGYRLHTFTLPFEVKSSLTFVGETESPADDPMAVSWKNLPGKPETFPPSTHTHTPAEAGALPANGTASDASRLGGTPAGCYRRVVNLLDNSDFLSPVNQRGKQSYTGSGYGIDRWRTNFSGDTVELVSGGVKNTVASTTGGWHMHQLCDGFQRYVGKTVTAAFCVAEKKGTGIRGVISFRNANDEEIVNVSTPLSAGVCTASRTVPEGTEMIRVGLYAYTGTLAGDYAVLTWAAVYECAAAPDTLPPYLPAGAAAEEAVCKRHFQLLQGTSSTPANTILTGFLSSESKRLYIPLPMIGGMRRTPDVTITGGIVIRKSDGGYYSEASYTSPYYGAVVTSVMSDNGGTVGIVVGKSDDTAWEGAVNNSIASVILYGSTSAIAASAEINP